MIGRNKMLLIVWVGFNHGLCLRLLSKHLLSVGFFPALWKGIPYVFSRAGPCVFASPKDLREMSLPEGLMLCWYHRLCLQQGKVLLQIFL